MVNILSKCDGEKVKKINIQIKSIVIEWSDVLLCGFRWLIQFQLVLHHFGNHFSYTIWFYLFSHCMCVSQCSYHFRILSLALVHQLNQCWHSHEIKTTINKTKYNIFWILGYKYCLHTPHMTYTDVECMVPQFKLIMLDLFHSYAIKWWSLFAVKERSKKNSRKNGNVRICIISSSHQMRFCLGLK